MRALRAIGLSRLSDARKRFCDPVWRWPRVSAPSVSSRRAMVDVNRFSPWTSEVTTRKNGAETWAESYTEWALTGGGTPNAASQYFADKYFWADNLPETTEKAVGERTIIVDTFSVSQEPEIITTVAKSVYVAFVPPVL